MSYQTNLRVVRPPGGLATFIQYFLGEPADSMVLRTSLGLLSGLTNRRI